MTVRLPNSLAERCVHAGCIVHPAEAAFATIIRRSPSASLGKDLVVDTPVFPYKISASQRPNKHMRGKPIPSVFARDEGNPAEGAVPAKQPNHPAPPQPIGDSHPGRCRSPAFDARHGRQPSQRPISSLHRNDGPPSYIGAGAQAEIESAWDHQNINSDSSPDRAVMMDAEIRQPGGGG
jgi:hypothetical protein